GRRGLSRNSSLKRLLDEHRGPSRGRLTLDLIQTWGEAYRATTGRWPNTRTGAVAGGPPGLTWRHVNAALYKGDRGLPGGMTLRHVFGRPVRRKPPEGWPTLTIPEILAWADAHREATGRWPSRNSGPIRDAPYPETWLAVDVGLSQAHRGLPGGVSLSRLLQ